MRKSYENNTRNEESLSVFENFDLYFYEKSLSGVNFGRKTQNDLDFSGVSAPSLFFAEFSGVLGVGDCITTEVRRLNIMFQVFTFIPFVFWP